MPPNQLNGLRVLVVDDEAMIGMLVEDILLEEGCEICGPHLTFTEGMKAAEEASIDVALLDVNLRGVKSYPIGEVLMARGIPFILLSGYGEGAAPAEHPAWPTCSKPFTFETLTASIRAVLT